jgi:hypothetical protein
MKFTKFLQVRRKSTSAGEVPHDEIRLYKVLLRKVEDHLRRNNSPHFFCVDVPAGTDFDLVTWRKVSRVFYPSLLATGDFHHDDKRLCYYVLGHPAWDFISRKI